MPRKPMKPCAIPGCPNLTEGRYCEKHQRQENKRYEKYDRDPAVRRRYGRVWKRIRDSYVKTHPFCELCYEKGVIVPVRKCITRCRLLKEELTSEAILYLCARAVTQRYMLSVVIVGVKQKNIIIRSDGRDNQSKNFLKNIFVRCMRDGRDGRGSKISTA